ncbi:hypothetical protein E1267_23985 [Nonomuraea longispora]|uniref:Uncharacterized protein n=1 Tax=Nonomuraea longispora TaxID=1848320 RepID=A0A4R4N5J5_9ACTN|nr:hypothetical protein [Nonomuraea longispora]TDC04058.1 hypothetical protein E1267_23985 [Nonomuraea longispora]
MEDLRPHDENGPIVAAVEQWRRDRAGVLEAEGISLGVEGPFEAPGIDPVYILRLERPPVEIHVCVFRGGVLDVTRVNWDDEALEQKGVTVLSAAELGAALDRIART